MAVEALAGLEPLLAAVGSVVLVGLLGGAEVAVVVVGAPAPEGLRCGAAAGFRGDCPLPAEVAVLLCPTIDLVFFNCGGAGFFTVEFCALNAVVAPDVLAVLLISVLVSNFLGSNQMMS